MMSARIRHRPRGLSSVSHVTTVPPWSARNEYSAVAGNGRPYSTTRAIR
jgi:hypothetical protein